MTAPRAIVIMGVAGSGKTTVGELLARELGWHFADADSFHPPENVSKMSAGTPLSDSDRAPWLAAIRSHLDDHIARDEGAVVTCSALKQSYRDVLLCNNPHTALVYLQGTRDQLWERISSRQNHFMKPSMLDSQLAALEEPADALTLNIAPAPVELVASIRRGLSL
ncbi:MAG: gluconokinase [Cephaloticoccus sp.]|jgi:carbohydrate kinase (thermoresistant glucokinase family)|nr:gluconokinase [Cephaloticoccus sp.]